MTEQRKVPDVVAPQGRFVSEDALKKLVERWKEKGWNTLLDEAYARAFRECAGDLEQLLKRKNDDRDRTS
jgi:histidinol-phosphate/aromatic aminotransferase/cobyric acid decarboxylase-like protein